MNDKLQKQLEDAKIEIRRLWLIILVKTLEIVVVKLKYGELEKEYNRVLHNLDLLTKQAKKYRAERFGQKSEQTSILVFEQLSLFTDEPKPFEPAKKRVKPQRKLGTKEWQNRVAENLETIVILHELSESELICKNCGSTLKIIGKELIRTEYDLGFPFAARVKHYSQKALCRICEADKSVETQIIGANVPKSLFPGSSLTNQSFALIVYSKYYLSMPLNRQADNFEIFGVPISRKTLTNNVLRAVSYFKEIYDELHKELKLQRVLHADETIMQVLFESGRKATQNSYMWVYCTALSEKRQIILYDYEETRASKHPIRMLEGFKGYLHSDGWGAYHKLSDLNTEIIVVGCWVHARRKFADVLKVVNSEIRGNAAAMPFFKLFNKIFELERNYTELPTDNKYKARFQARMANVKPIADELFRLADNYRGHKDDALGKAVNYMHNQRKYLLRVFDDGRLEFSNNHAENVIRPFVIGRKNWMFAGNVGGANASAVYFSIIQTAKINGLNPYKYSLRVLDLAAEGLPANELLPWNIKMS